MNNTDSYDQSAAMMIADNLLTAADEQGVSLVGIDSKNWQRFLDDAFNDGGEARVTLVSDLAERNEDGSHTDYGWQTILTALDLVRAYHGNRDFDARTLDGRTVPRIHPAMARRALESNDGLVEGIVSVPLSDLVHNNNFERFLDILSEKMIGNDLLMDIVYRLVGAYPERELVNIQVSGVVDEAIVDMMPDPLTTDG